MLSRAQMVMWMLRVNKRRQRAVLLSVRRRTQMDMVCLFFEIPLFLNTVTGSL